MRAGLRLPRAISRVALPDRKSTCLNSSHTVISYAVFCLKKKKDSTDTRISELDNNEYSTKSKLDTHIPARCECDFECETKWIEKQLTVMLNDAGTPSE